MTAPQASSTMGDMKRKAACMVAVILALSAGFAWAQSLDDLDAILDFSVTIKTLSEAVERGEYDMEARFVALNGTLNSVFDADAETSTVIVEMVTGEWIGLEEVRSYHCLVRLMDPELFPLFPLNPPRVPEPEVFIKGSRLLVIAFPVAVVELGDGRLMWLLDGVYVRRL